MKPIATKSTVQAALDAFMQELRDHMAGIMSAIPEDLPAIASIVETLAPQAAPVIAEGEKIVEEVANIPEHLKDPQAASQQYFT